MNKNTELVRLEILIPRTIKKQIEQQAAQAKQPVNRYGGKLVAKKVQSFDEAANSFLQLSIKLDALIGLIHANERIPQQDNSQLRDSNEEIKPQIQIATYPPLDIINYFLSNQLSS
jgi:hypothetical protein